jgi:hypothetical protein
MSPPCYRIVIERKLGPRYASALNGMTLRADSGEPEIVGRIAGLGLTVHSLTAVDTENARADAPAHPQPAGVNHRNPGTTSKGP